MPDHADASQTAVTKHRAPARRYTFDLGWPFEEVPARWLIPLSLLIVVGLPLINALR